MCADYKLFGRLLLYDFAAEKGVEPEDINFGEGGAPRVQRQATARMKGHTVVDAKALVNKSTREGDEATYDPKKDQPLHVDIDLNNYPDMRNVKVVIQARQEACYLWIRESETGQVVLVNIPKGCTLVMSVDKPHAGWGGKQAEREYALVVEGDVPEERVEEIKYAAREVGILQDEV